MTAQIDCVLPYASSIDNLDLDSLPNILHTNDSSHVWHLKKGVFYSFDQSMTLLKLTQYLLKPKVIKGLWLIVSTYILKGIIIISFSFCITLVVSI